MSTPQTAETEPIAPATSLLAPLPIGFDYETLPKDEWNKMVTGGSYQGADPYINYRQRHGRKIMKQMDALDMEERIDFVGEVFTHEGEKAEAWVRDGFRCEYVSVQRLSIMCGVQAALTAGKQHPHWRIRLFQLQRDHPRPSPRPHRPHMRNRSQRRNLNRITPFQPRPAIHKEHHRTNLNRRELRSWCELCDIAWSDYR
jgi:hypothetical protein